MKTILSLIFLVITINSYSQKDSCKLTQTFFPSGKVEMEGCEKKGKREGLWKEYAETGDKHFVRFVWTYKDGMKDGSYKALGETGKIEATGKYKSGCLTDTLKSFNDAGELTDYTVWKIADANKGTSVKVAEKVIIAPGKPDYTEEVIDGKKYIWISGRKYETN